MVDFKVISTGSQGNAVVIENRILIDCGVPWREIKPYADQLKLVLLTHIHSDHFNKAAIKRLAGSRPTLKFMCCAWLAEPLLSCGVQKRNIYVCDFANTYGIGALCNVRAEFLKHNVPNCAWHIHMRSGKVFYATDCNNLNGIFAPNYDLYLVEANYGEKEIKERIKAKEIVGIYAYEKQVLKNHLSKEKCNDFIYANAGAKSRYVYMHMHGHKEVSTSDNHGENNQL
ncbi:MAG: MBL fold metallo-hydrolase [Clostridiales bacterium]|nr:MBL fold metallo-hydrolase [Clostridiales bacterium]